MLNRGPLTLNGGRITYAVAAAANFNGGTPIAATGELAVNVGAPASYVGGLGYGADASLCVNVGGAPVAYVAGIGVDAQGRVCLDTGGAIGPYVAGIPLTAAGALAAFQAAGPASYVLYDGTDGCRVDTPDSAATSPTGDIELIARVAPTNWATTQAVLEKYGVGAGQFAYSSLITGSKLRFRRSVDGTASETKDSTAAGVFTNNVFSWVRITRAAASGDINFYYAADQDPIPSVWTDMGVNPVASTPGNIFDGPANLTLGCTAGGAFNTLKFVGKFKRAILRSVIGGAAVADFNAADGLIGASTVLSSTTGETWTLRGTAQLQ